MSMLRTIAAAAALTLAGLAAASLVPASAGTNLPPLPARVTYETALEPVYFGTGDYAGTLNLNIAKDGVLSGFYRFDDVGTLREVTGGLEGDHVWLDLGPGGPHIFGKFTDGKITGYTTYEGHQPYRFTATPEAAHL
jgi:ABC-type transport system substrate-binding protein